MESESIKLITMVLAVIIYALKAYLQKRDVTLSNKAEAAQAIILNVITQVKSMDKDEAKEDLKKIAITSIRNELDENKKVKKLFKDLGIKVDDGAIGSYIEVALHAAKLGINNILKDKFKAAKAV